MELSQSQPENKQTMSMAIPQLLTPEEHIADSFTKSVPTVPVQTASPPASPEFRSFSTDFAHDDALLYPDSNNEQGTADKPLFDTDTTTSRWRTPEAQESPQTAPSLSEATPSPANIALEYDEPLQSTAVAPSRTKYNSKATPVGIPAILQKHGLMDYFRYCLAQNEDYQRMKMENRQLPPLSTSRGNGRDSYTQQVVSSLGRSRVEKVRAPRSPAGLKANKVMPARGSPAPVKTASPIKRHRRQTSTPDRSGAGLPSAQPKPRTRAQPSKKVDDAPVPDFCPPLSSLDNTTKELKASWTNNNRLNIDAEPNRDLLHPRELDVAAILRLRPDEYLQYKKRIFATKVAHMKEGKDFNKTAAQGCLPIDVNKSSRLWDAFNNVGWFDEKWFVQYL